MFTGVRRIYWSKTNIFKIYKLWNNWNIENNFPPYVIHGLKLNRRKRDVLKRSFHSKREWISPILFAILILMLTHVRIESITVIKRRTAPKVFISFQTKNTLSTHQLLWVNWTTWVLVKLTIQKHNNAQMYIVHLAQIVLLIFFNILKQSTRHLFLKSGLLLINKKNLSKQLKLSML